MGKDGLCSDKFDGLRLVRSGPTSVLLVMCLVTSILAINVKGNDNIGGITYSKRNFQIIQIADNTSIFFWLDQSQLPNSFHYLKNVNQCQVSH